MLTLTNVSRVFGRKEKFTAVADISLQVTPGKIHALLGPNGAGKTTTVRMCATLLRPTSGSIEIAGIDAVKHPELARYALSRLRAGMRRESL
ncbi:ATP-binding cassette domain-containing protein [Arcanobacterium hippocoleae]|uniref:ATP-binding cassette domain-containing protein n=1 Tax=Arcanobacterium hippocoleae TaxID=149017 RepID=UPI00333EEE86